MGLDFALNNLCRNPDLSGTTIWCYTNDPNLVREECYPVNFCYNTIISNGILSKSV